MEFSRATCRVPLQQTSHVEWKDWPSMQQGLFATAHRRPRPHARLLHATQEFQVLGVSEARRYEWVKLKVQRSWGSVGGVGSHGGCRATIERA